MEAENNIKTNIWNLTKIESPKFNHKHDHTVRQQAMYIDNDLHVDFGIVFMCSNSIFAIIKYLLAIYCLSFYHCTFRFIEFMLSWFYVSVIFLLHEIMWLQMIFKIRIYFTIINFS